MIVYDIVRIVGPATLTSYPPNSRTLVEHYDDWAKAEYICGRFNECRNVDDYRYEVEPHDEESPQRAMPVK